MTKTYLNRFKWFVLLVLIQVFLLNKISICGVATPFLYVWFFLKLNRSVSHTELLLWGFSMGLLIDVFCDTPGVNAAATTLLAFVRPFVLRLFTQRDQYDDFEPGVRTMHFTPFLFYTIYLILIHHVTLFLLDTFSFSNVPLLLFNIFFSLLFTLFFVTVLELFRNK